MTGNFVVYAYITLGLKFTDVWQWFETRKIVESSVLKNEAAVLLAVKVIRFGIPPAENIDINFTKVKAEKRHYMIKHSRQLA